MIYQTLHRKLQIELHEPTNNQGRNSCDPEVANWSVEKWQQQTNSRYKIPQRNPQIEKYEPSKQQWWTQVVRKENQFLNGNETIGYFYFSL